MFLLLLGFFFSLSLLLLRPKLLPEEERRRENMAQSGDTKFSVRQVNNTQAVLKKNNKKKQRKKRKTQTLKRSHEFGDFNSLLQEHLNCEEWVWHMHVFFGCLPACLPVLSVCHAGWWFNIEPFCIWNVLYNTVQRARSSLETHTDKKKKKQTKETFSKSLSLE